MQLAFSVVDESNERVTNHCVKNRQVLPAVFSIFPEFITTVEVARMIQFNEITKPRQAE